MAESKLIQTELGQIRLEEYLGSGQIATVHKGVFLDGEQVGQQVAVKTALAGTESIRPEYDLLLALANGLDTKGYSSTVPWVKLSKDSNALIMEFVGDENLLSKRINDFEQDFDREQLALDAAIQYAQLLDGLHSLAITSSDRKTTDFFWIKEGTTKGRLIVLDWNAVTRDAKNFGGDILLFGHLWYQLVTGRIAPSRIDPFDDALWVNGRVTFGIRHLLTRILSVSEDQQLSSAQELIDAISDLKALYEKTGRELLKEGDKLLTEIKRHNASLKDNLRRESAFSDLDAQSLFEPKKEWLALTCLDLAKLKGENTQAQREECLQLVHSQSKRLVEYAKHFVGIDDNRNAQRAIGWALSISSRSGNADLELAALRWNLLVQGMKLSLDNKVYVRREVWTRISSCIEDLELRSSSDSTQAEWNKLYEEMTSAMDQLGSPQPESLIALLDELRHEISERRLRSTIREAEHLGMYSQALDALNSEGNSGTQNSRNSSLQGEHFRRTLATVLTSTDKLRSQITAKAKRQDAMERWSAEVSPAKVVSRPEYIDYLLRIRVKDAREDIGNEEAERAQDWLEHLRELHVAFAMNDAEGWRRAAVWLWRQDTNKERLETSREEVLKQLMQLSELAREFASFPVQLYDVKAKELIDSMLKFGDEIQN